MPVIHGALTADDGPVLRVRFALTRPAAVIRRRAGGVVPAPIEVFALVDTGAQVTCVDPSVAARLAAVPATATLANLAAAGGTAPTLQYELDVSVRHPTDPTARPLAVPGLEVLAVPLSGMGYDAILGRDVLASCVLIYDGTAGTFTLSY